jgi:hypothetical protein
MTCPNCQHENRPTAKFCTRCRTPLPRACPQCGLVAYFDWVRVLTK